MPTLPTFDVTATVANRILAAFQGETDAAGNPLTPQQAYKRWLRLQLLSRVQATEAKSERTQWESDLPL